MTTHQALCLALTSALRTEGYLTAERLARFIDDSTDLPVKWQVSARSFLHAGCHASAVGALADAENCCEGLDLPRIVFFAD